MSLWGSDLRTAPRVVPTGGPHAAGQSAARTNEASGLPRATPPPPACRGPTPPVSRPRAAPGPKIVGGIEKVLPSAQVLHDSRSVVSLRLRLTVEFCTCMYDSMLSLWLFYVKRPALDLHDPFV